MEMFQDAQEWEYDDRWTICAYPGLEDVPLDDPRISSELRSMADQLIAVEGALRLQILDAGAGVWDGSVVEETKHKDLFQVPNPPRIAPSSNGWSCEWEGCDQKGNLWMNLSDGKIFCGRSFFDGSGGRDHAVRHYERTQYPLAVKLGTITPHSADVWSYSEDASVSPSLPLLSSFLPSSNIEWEMMFR